MNHIIMEHIIINIILFIISVAFMLDNTTDDYAVVDLSMIKDIIICYILCAICIYSMFGLIYFIVTHGSTLQPLL